MNSEQAAVLRAPFPPGAIGQLPRAGIKLDYVGHAAVTDRLLKADPAWTWEPLAFGDDGRPLIIVRGSEASMWIRLTVCDVTRIGVGTVKSDAFEVEKQLIGDAIRNAAMRFGVALDLWSKEELPGFDTGAGLLSDTASSPGSTGTADGNDLSGPAPVPTSPNSRPQPDRTRPDPTVSERRDEPPPPFSGPPPRPKARR